MFKCILPIYWIPDLRVLMFPSKNYAITPICFAVDSESGRILSYAFSYGLARTNLLSLGVLALREKNLRPGGSSHMFRSTLGDLNLASRKLGTDCATSSLTDFRCTKPGRYRLHKAGAVLGHFFYDWPDDFIGEVDDFGYFSSRLLTRLIENMVSRFNCFIESGDITCNAAARSLSP
jgi:hypothetical protein